MISHIFLSDPLCFFQLLLLDSVFNSAKPSSQAPSTDLQFGALNKVN